MLARYLALRSEDLGSVGTRERGRNHDEDDDIEKEEDEEGDGEEFMMWDSAVTCIALSVKVASLPCLRMAMMMLTQI